MAVEFMDSATGRQRATSSIFMNGYLWSCAKPHACHSEHPTDFLTVSPHVWRP